MSITTIVGSSLGVVLFSPSSAIAVTATVALAAIVAVFVLLAFAPYLPPEWEEKIAGAAVDSNQRQHVQNAD